MICPDLFLYCGGSWILQIGWLSVIIPGKMRVAEQVKI